jgi:allantoinase
MTLQDSIGDAVQTSRPPLEPKGALTSYSTFLNSRPPSFETYAIDEIISLAHLAPRLPLHIVHLSAIEAIPILREARERGIKITAETCFHYLALAAEHVAEGDTRHKCCPPIRAQSNQDGLWEELKRCKASYSPLGLKYLESLRRGSSTSTLGDLSTSPETSSSLSSSPDRRGSNADSSFTPPNELQDCVIQTVVSDHSPCTAGLKLLPMSVSSDAPSADAASDEGKGDFFAAWGGISSVGLGLPILWSQASKRQITLPDIVRWCSTNTSAQVGLEGVKGDLGIGFDADIIVFDPETEWKVGRKEMLFRNKCSPYEERVLKGIVRETWVRGQKIFERKGATGDEVVFPGEVAGTGPAGKLLLEKRRWAKY